MRSPQRATLATATAVLAMIVGLVALGLADEPTPEPIIQSTPAISVLHEVEINLPSIDPKIDTGLTTINGDPIGISCNTCHSLLGEEVMAQTVAELEVFHQGLVMNHGDQKCAACHEQDSDMDLHLADGTVIDFDQSMKLCAQCHGPQHRDYQNGSHGGMTGHWDLTQGGRQRNHCINCHDPHAPAYPQVMPVFPPQDRFLETENAGGHHE